MKYTIHINEDKGQSFSVAPEMPLSDVLIEMGMPIHTPCGGRGICGKCRVQIDGKLSDPTAFENNILGKDSQFRLACQARPLGDITVKSAGHASPSVKTHALLNNQSKFGIAVDIGTTSVQISLVDLKSGEAFLVDTFLNPQRRFGDDVMSRIAAASDPAVFQTQVNSIRERVYSSCIQAVSAHSLSPEQIKRFVIGGNTTMLHFFYGLDVSSMGVYPFIPFTLDFTPCSADKVGMPLFSHATLQSFPAISAFLGSDVVGGLALCCQAGLNSNTYFIDLGTNGEIFVIDGAGDIYATSCAMGPALEGMNISSGMTAAPGAIIHFSFTDNKLMFETINNESPVGLTGTALIELVTILHKLGIVGDSGAFSENLESMSLPVPLSYSLENQIRHIRLSPQTSLSQGDVRNLQLSKAASLAASQLLLNESLCDEHDIRHVVIAGAFGEHLDITCFKYLEFIPEFSNARFHVKGNTSLAAAQNACLNPELFTEASLLRDRVQSVQLNTNSEFNDAFIDALNFTLQD